MGHDNDDRSKVNPILLDSIAVFLLSNGFSRTLKKFRSEAHLQEDGGKSPAVDLEEVCLKFMTSINDTMTSDAVKQDAEKKPKHKKKNAKHSTEIQKGDEKNTGPRESVLNEGGVLVKEDKVEKKSKDKNKKACYSADFKVEECKEDGRKCINNGKSFLDVRGGLAKNDDKNSEEAVISKDNKATKKRKRNVSKGNETETPNEDAIDEFRTKCVDAYEDFQTEKKKLKASTNSEKSSGLNAITKNGHDGPAQEAVLMHCNGVDNNVVQRERNLLVRKPTSAKAFQRVKVEEVVFLDERLKDKSYWAKDWAETGYGAKAQEVLGQVRGRDFRHERQRRSEDHTEEDRSIYSPTPSSSTTQTTSNTKLLSVYFLTWLLGVDAIFLLSHAPSRSYRFRGFVFGMRERRVTRDERKFSNYLKSKF